MRLAGHAADPARVPRMIPGTVNRIMDQLAAHPVGIHDATWELLHWNPLFAAAFGEPASLRTNHIYARCIEAQADADSRRITDALGPQDTQAVVRLCRVGSCLGRPAAGLAADGQTVEDQL